MPSSSSSSSDEDEDAIGASESTAHAQEKDQEKERKRQRKERKEKKEKKEKKHKKEKKEKKEKHRHKDKKAKRAADDPAALAAARAAVEASMQPIAESDYFLRTKEFQLWLSESRGTFLDEIPSEEARSLFRKFVAKWNAKELPPKYYVGLASQGEGAGGADGATRASRHVWGFTSNITEQERFQLDRAKVAAEAKSAGSAEQEALARAESRAQQMLERKQFRKHGKDAMEELVPRADPGSREARLEKRGAQTAFHRAGTRDESAGLERSDAELMGGNTGSDSFGAAVARRSQQQARRADDRSARHAELQAKEDARNAAFKASMAGFL